MIKRLALSVLWRYWKFLASKWSDYSFTVFGPRNYWISWQRIMAPTKVAEKDIALLTGNLIIIHNSTRCSMSIGERRLCAFLSAALARETRMYTATWGPERMRGHR